MRSKALILLMLLSSPAFAQLQKLTVPVQPVPPFAKVVLATLIAPADGVYMVSGNLWLSGGWYTRPVVMSVGSSVAGQLDVCGSTALFASTGPGEIPAIASCTTLIALKQGDRLSLAVYHESGEDVTVDGQRTTLALVRIVTQGVKPRAQEE